MKRRVEGHAVISAKVVFEQEDPEGVELVDGEDADQLWDYHRDTALDLIWDHIMKLGNVEFTIEEEDFMVSPDPYEGLEEA